ncbi:hypothetical protein B0T20DRAFT_59857 [Sordaria brevicollis]|uniref:F-box domain-containing protein n=1 Tax=Sordaria brevicollis TaxID=83679 RepID=A0AAE0P3M1_SORBR|nr:hypothetical protein B0T20DRAFT_59857 [Sordaria brevicollis]
MAGVKRLRPDTGFANIASATPENMQNSLAQQFEALGSDAGLRLANLRRLLSSLTPQENQYMRLYFQSFPTPRRDIIPLFPTDILVEITRYLSPFDIANILDVSKMWRKSWSQRDVVRALAKHHMPRFLQFYDYREKLQSSEETDQNLSDVFYQAALKFNTRQQGLFQSMISIPAPWLHWVTRDRFFALEPTDSIKGWDDVFPDGDDEDHVMDNVPNETGVPSFPGEFAYCNGKVAWQPATPDMNLASLTFVDDLRTQQRRVYQIPDPVLLRGSCAYLQALGNELVVVSAGRTCHAWDLETGEHDSVMLPAARIHRVMIEKKRTYILTDEADVYVWSFRRGLREVDTNTASEAAIDGVLDGDYGVPISYDPMREGLFDILPHPDRDDRFYLLSLNEQSDRELVVHEFNHDGLVRSHTTALPEVSDLIGKLGHSGTSDFGFDVRMDEEDYLRICTHKVDTYGNYAICQFFLSGRLVKPDHFRGLHDEDEGDDLFFHGDDDHWVGYTVFFNALTASVSTTPFIYDAFQSAEFPPMSTFWGGQQIELIRAPTARDDDRFRMLLVSEFNGQKRFESMDDLPIHCTWSFYSLREPVPVNHRVTESLGNSPVKEGRMVQGQRCSNIVSRYLYERFDLMPSISPIYGLDITFEFSDLKGRVSEDEEEHAFHDDRDGSDLTIMADDDFLICRGPKGYVAWSFCHDMRDKHVTV